MRRLACLGLVLGARSRCRAPATRRRLPGTTGERRPRSPGDDPLREAPRGDGPHPGPGQGVPLHPPEVRRRGVRRLRLRLLGLRGLRVERVCPEAEADLGTHRKDTRPHTSEFVLLLGSIPKGEARGHWLRVARVQDLEPGDVIAWESPGKKPDGETIQPHTMVVHGPVRKDPADPDELIVPITDSTHSPTHTRDSRKESGATGVGTERSGSLSTATGRPRPIAGPSARQRRPAPRRSSSAGSVSAHPARTRVPC